LVMRCRSSRVIALPKARKLFSFSSRPRCSRAYQLFQPRHPGQNNHPNAGLTVPTPQASPGTIVARHLFFANLRPYSLVPTAYSLLSSAPSSKPLAPCPMLLTDTRALFLIVCVCPCGSVANIYNPKSEFKMLFAPRPKPRAPCFFGCPPSTVVCPLVLPSSVIRITNNPLSITSEIPTLAVDFRQINLYDFVILWRCTDEENTHSRNNFHAAGHG
jgi:hypothetical protein